MINTETIEMLNELALGKARVVTRGFWNKRENRISAVNMFMNAIPRRPGEEVLLKVQPYQLRASNIGNLFRSIYQSSMKNLVDDVYPEKSHLFSKKQTKAENRFSDIDYCADKLEEISSELDIPVEAITYGQLLAYKYTYMLSYHSIKRVKAHCQVRNLRLLDKVL